MHIREAIEQKPLQLKRYQNKGKHCFPNIKKMSFITNKWLEQDVCVYVFIEDSPNLKTNITCINLISTDCKYIHLTISDHPTTFLLA